MKKFLLLSALAIGAITANAQSFTITVGGDPVENGATITSYQVNEIMAEYGALQMDPEVIVTSPQDANIQVTVTNTTTDASAPKIQYCFPSLCKEIERGNSLTTTGPLLANNPTNLRLETVIMYEMPEKGFTNSCEVAVTAGSNTVKFNLNMVYDPNFDAAVDGIDADEATPEYFTLSGVKVSNPDKGIYIVKRGSKVSKIVF